MGGYASEEFRPPERAIVPAAESEPYVPPKPEPIEWDPERVAKILKAFGWVLHSLDPVDDPQLWLMTGEDLSELAPPVARIANRHEPIRQVAQKSDEIAVGLATFPYVQRNLAARGRARKRAQRAPQQQPAHPVVDYPPPTAQREPEPPEDDEAEEGELADDPHPAHDDVFGTEPGVFLPEFPEDHDGE